MLDSQCVRAAEAGGPHGYDAGKEVLGRKRQTLVDIDGGALKLLERHAVQRDEGGAAAKWRE